MTLIDLGDLSGPTTTEPTARRRPAGLRRRAAGRWWSIGLVTVAALVALAGAAPPGTRVHATVPAALGSELFLAEEYIFTITPAPRVTDGTQELAAYPRPTRATVAPRQLTALWRIPVPPGHRFYRVETVAGDGVLLAMVPPGNTGGDSQTVLLDVRTGQERWRTVGFGTPDPSGRVLLQTFGFEEPMTLRAVDLADGRELWSTTSPPGWLQHHWRDGVIDAIVLSTNAGDVDVLDATTGEVRHRLPRSAAHPSAYQQSSLVGDLVLVVSNSRVVTAYGIDGLVRRWQTTLPLAEQVTRCGELLCVQAGGGGTHVLDPATGALRWRTDVDAELLRVTGARGLAQLRGSPGRELVLLDSATGAVLTDYAAWASVASYEQEQELYGVHTIPEVGLVLARLDPAQAQPRRLDVLAGAAGGCQSRDGLIGCRRHDGGFGVWQLPE
ncbi:outer membrane protein assembly factor BamB family protein [Micromonospora radicis]|uniref:Pyrrolo-quinoline quinone repeat domain-containing protein n=1 Tax=Micromonospora radicis TaxID=1894971 RepID=A0A418N061_9ACTN|nr:PQQ-binding-like beta-propeller repeat protein [Micromonospora radicis]RIV40884.1 hypothetical protein D2L64_04665 [Micromonospora radicis]